MNSRWICSSRQEVWVLDFDKTRVHAGPVPVARRVADLRRLARSAGKLKMQMGEEGWSALEEGYGAEWPPRLLLT